MSILISIDQASVSNGNQTILNHISLKIPAGKIISIIGPSGSGKTTLLKLMLDLLFPEKGWRLSGNITRFPGLRAGYLNQNPALQMFANYVFEEFTACTKEQAATILNKIDATYLLDRKSQELSQGEKTIVAILRTFASNLGLIILDEAMVNLAPHRRTLLEAVITDYKNKGGTVVLVDHAPNILEIADHIFLLENGQVTLLEKNFTPALTPVFATNSSNQNLIAPNKLVIAELQSKYISKTLNTKINIAASSGDIIGIVGDNGSGKSTLLEIICGIKKPDQGSILWGDQKLKGLRARKGLVAIYTQEHTQQFLSSKVKTELAIAGIDLSCNKTKNIIELFRLDAILDNYMASLCFGAKQRLAITLTLLAKVPILVFDEPTYGMDKSTLENFYKIVRLLAEQQKIVLIASHDMLLLSNLTKQIIYL